MKIFTFILLVLMSNALLAKDYYIGFSQGLSEADIKKMIKSSFEFSAEHAQPGDKIMFMDAVSFQTLGEVNIPEDEAYKHKKVKAKLVKKPLVLLRRNLLKNVKLNPEIEGKHDIDLPKFLKNLSVHVIDINKENSILIYGDALYKDEKEPYFSMKDNFFPSDGHLSVDEFSSVYGTRNKGNYLKKVDVHFLVSNSTEDWNSSLYKYRIKRFWAMFVQSQGGTLQTFSEDMGTVFSRISQSSFPVLEQFNLDETMHKVEMLRVIRDVNSSSPTTNTAALSDSQFMDDQVQISTTPPISMSGPIKIGIKWEECQTACDLDLYSQVQGATTPLYYSNKEDSTGKYFKDFQSSGQLKNGLEYVEFFDEDLRTIESRVRFYAGSNSTDVSGVVRIYFANNVYEQPFKINASVGATTVFDIAKIVGI